MKLVKLKKKLKDTQQELYDLHLNEPSEVYYRQKREELEFNIVILEDQIEFEKSMLPFQIALGVFIVAALTLIVVALVASPY
jgi:hypothetical protein